MFSSKKTYLWIFNSQRVFKTVQTINLVEIQKISNQSVL